MPVITPSPQTKRCPICTQTRTVNTAPKDKTDIGIDICDDCGYSEVKGATHAVEFITHCLASYLDKKGINSINYLNKSIPLLSALNSTFLLPLFIERSNQYKSQYNIGSGSNLLVLTTDANGFFKKRVTIDASVESITEIADKLALELVYVTHSAIDMTLALSEQLRPNASKSTLFVEDIPELGNHIIQWHNEKASNDPIPLASPFEYPRGKINL